MSPRKNSSNKKLKKVAAQGGTSPVTEANTCIFAQELEPEHCQNGAYLIVCFLNHALQEQLSTRAVSMHLKSFEDQVEGYDEDDTDAVWHTALQKTLGSFNLKKTISECKKIHYNENPDADMLSEVLLSNDFVSLFRKGVKRGAKQFALFDERNGYVSVVATTGPMSEAELEAFVLSLEKDS